MAAKKNSKIRKSARGQDCQVRIPHVCNFNPETTVLAHLNGGGMGMKNPDYQGAYCCSDCHDAIDFRRNLIKEFGWMESDIKLMHFEGVMRTQKLLIEQGLIVVK